MKNKFLFVFMLLLFSMGAATAQNATHWPQEISHPGHWDPLNMTVTAVVQIDGEETTSPNLEIAAFIGDTLVSIGTMPIVTDGRYMYFITLFGYDELKPGYAAHPEDFDFNHLKFKLYNHDTEEEMTNCYTQILYTSNGVYGGPTNPLEINFFSDETSWELVTDPTVLKGGDALLITNTDNTLALSEVQNAKSRGSSPITVDSNGNITFLYPEPQSYDSTYYSEDDEEDVTETFWHYPPQIITLHEETEHLTMFVYDGYLYAGSSSSNMLVTQAAPTSDGYWEFTYADGEISIVAQGENTRNTLRYAANSQTFNCFEGNKQQPVNVYRAVTGSAPVPETYTLDVTVDPEEAGAVAINPDQETYEAGTEVTLTATAVEGYQFAGFTIGEELITESPYTITINANTEVVASFTQIEYNVTIAADPAEGGTAAITEAGPYHLGDVITLTNTPAEGYEFVNYTVGETVVTSPYTVTGDAAIVANFDQIEYNVTIAADPAEGGTAAITEAGPYHLGDVITLTNTPAEGYEFVNYTVGETVVTSPYTVTGDAAIVANFDQIEYNVTIAANNEGWGTAAITEAGPYHFGDVINLTATPAEGYTFVNFTVGDAVVTTPYTVTGEAAIIANFIEEIVNTYTIQVVASPAEGGTVTGGGTYVEDQNITLSATPNEGYRFDEWQVNGITYETAQTIEITVTENLTFTAIFAKIPYSVTITANPAEGGTAAIVEEGPYYLNDVLTLTATPAEGYVFTNFTVGEEVVTSPYTVTGEAAIVANFEIVVVPPTTYGVTVTVNPAEAGTVTGAGIYAEGAEVTLTATAAEGYVFTNWTIGEETITENPYTFTIADDVEATAQFEIVVVPPTTYGVTVTVNPAEAGTVTGAGIYAEGAEVTLEATAATGYEFANWTIGEETITENPYTFTIAANVEAVANFNEVIVPPTTYGVTVFVNPEEAGTVEGAGIYVEGTEVTLTATAAEGYEFVNFTVGNEAILVNPYTFTVTDNVQVIANFNEVIVPVEHTITIAEVENGAITAPATANVGETVTVIATPEDEYRLVSLYYYTTDPTDLTDIDLGSMQFVMPDADITIGATFEMVLIGDVNMDGLVNIVDVVATLNYILEKDPQPFNFAAADMNSDGTIDISDAMAINAAILGMKSECNDESATYAVIDGKLYIESELALAGYQFRLSAEPAGIDLAGFNAMGNWSNGEYILVVYNLSGEKESGLYSVLDMGNATVSDVIMSTKEGCKVRGIDGVVSVASFDESVYNIYPVPANNVVTVAGPNVTSIDVFNMMGQHVMTVNANSNETVVNISQLNAGSYLFRINTTNGVATKNVIVVR